MGRTNNRCEAHRLSDPQSASSPASTGCQQRSSTLSCANSSSSFHIFSADAISASVPLLHVILGLPLALPRSFGFRTKVISETALGTIESVLPHCDVRSAAYTTPSHFILTPGRPDLALNPQCQTLGGSATNTNFKVLGVTRPGIEPVPPDL
ncbi:hypothetical protein ElyMa_002481100 [Elysia marginata]|uniref:Uncharacterized protein n=1 Tax=Elysia marginata TaxID=1093978 RepID=A0AAV4GNE3_9GAST|nr:hypothetical protein ElyMa_002481100 [Elysia marginata]